MTNSYKKRNPNNRKTRRSKNKIYRKIQMGGGITATYEPTPPDMAELPIRQVNLIGTIGMYQSANFNNAEQNYPKPIYLAGYGNFIGPNKLCPVYYNNQDDELNHFVSIMKIYKPCDVAQVYYYISQTVFSNCIVTAPYLPAQNEKDLNFTTRILRGYKGESPKFTLVPRPDGRGTIATLNADDVKYGDKFLIMPTSYQTQVDGDIYGRTIYTFTPTPETNIYKVPQVGNVIMNDPGNGEPWYGHKIIVVFGNNFKPPAIVGNDDDDGCISKAVGLAVGAELSAVDK